MSIRPCNCGMLCCCCKATHALVAGGHVAVGLRSQQARLLHPGRHQPRELVDAVGAVDAQVGRAGAIAQALAGLRVCRLLKTLNPCKSLSLMQLLQLMRRPAALAQQPRLWQACARARSLRSDVTLECSVLQGRDGCPRRAQVRRAWRRISCSWQARGRSLLVWRLWHLLSFVSLQPRLQKKKRSAGARAMGYEMQELLRCAPSIRSGWQLALSAPAYRPETYRLMPCTSGCWPH